MSRAWEDVDETARTEGLVDADALGRWMDERDLPGKGEPVETTFISGGSSNEIFEIRRGEHRMALRRPPRKVPEGRNETMLREFRVLEALNGTDVPHPEAIAGCDDPSVIGACFYLMAMIDGWSPMGMGSEWPEPFNRDLDARKGLGIQLVDGIARLSRVDWRAKGLEGFGKPDGFLDRQADRWVAHYEKMKVRELDNVDVVAQWLRDNKPSRYEPGIIHGDYQFANVMFAHGAPARLAAMVDWEMATIGDPLADVGYLCTLWVDRHDPTGRMFELSGVTRKDGFPLREELVARYEERSGRAMTDIRWYRTLALWKSIVFMEGNYKRALSGATDDPYLKGFGEGVIQLAQRAEALARGH